MANITAAMVSELRARTSVGMMDCKKALVECDGDMERACDYLREKGLAKAAKKAERTAAQGRMFTYVHSNAKLAGAASRYILATDYIDPRPPITAC